MHVGRIHHVGIAVPDLEESIAHHVALLGASVALRETLSDQGVEAVALTVGDSFVELIQPIDPNGGVARFLERRGAGLHHVAYEVDDIAGTLAAIAAAGGQLIDAAPRVGLGGHLVAFVHPRSLDGVLTELVQTHHHPEETT